MSIDEQQGLLAICLLAAFADGGKDERERARVREVAESIAGPDFNTASLYRDVLLKKVTVEDAAAALTSPEARQLAYEMAVSVCDADGVATDTEKEFLARLSDLLDIPKTDAVAIAREADVTVAAASTVPALPPAPPPAKKPEADAQTDGMIVRYAILAGALELLPQSLASVAILPLQVKMVYRIGRSFGFTLDAGHIKEFIATVGLGLTGQMLDGLARRFLGKMAKRMAGGLAGKITGTAASAGVSFATTWALGQVARQYYSSGRRLDMMQLKSLFASLRTQGEQLQARHAGDIRNAAANLDLKSVLSGKLDAV